MGKAPIAQQPMWPWTPKKLSLATAPSIQGIFKAGDSHEYSSALFTQLSTGPNEPSWQPLFEAFSQVTSRKPFSPQLAYTKNFPKSALGSRRRRKSRRVESADLSVEKRASFPRKRSHSRSRDHATPFRPLKPFGTVALDAITADNPSDDIRDIVVLQGQPCIPISAEELVALSFVLGAPLTLDHPASNNEKNTRSINGTGAFGLSLRSEPSLNNVHQIRLQYTQPHVIQQPAPSGSYSTLFAKHLACSSLPFASDASTTQALFIDATVVAALKAGHSTIGLPTPLSSRQATYLSRLPSSTNTSFHRLDPQPASLSRPRHAFPHRTKSVTTSNSTSPTPPSASPRRLSWPALSRRSVSGSDSSSPSSSPTPLALNLPSIVSTLPFTGGLAPLASLPVVNAIRFTASAGRAPGALLPLLENLIHKIQRYAPSTDFGPYLSPRNMLKWLRTAGYVEYSPSVEATDIGTGVGRVSRYVAAVHALMGMLKEGETGILMDGTKEKEREKEKETEIEDACRVEMEESYREAVASTIAVREIEKETLGATLAEILKKPLPFDLATVATVARLVVAAWTWQVGVVVWCGEEREEVMRWKGAQGVYEVIEFDKLPGSMVLA